MWCVVRDVQWCPVTCTAGAVQYSVQTAMFPGFLVGWQRAEGRLTEVSTPRSPRESLAGSSPALRWCCSSCGEADPPSFSSWTSDQSPHSLVSSTVGSNIFTIYFAFIFFAESTFLSSLQSNFSNNVKVFFLSNQSLKIKINLSSFSVLENSKQI